MRVEVSSYPHPRQPQSDGESVLQRDVPAQRVCLKSDGLPVTYGTRSFYKAGVFAIAHLFPKCHPHACATH